MPAVGRYRCQDKVVLLAHRGAAATTAELVIPVVLVRAQALDGGIEFQHCPGVPVANLVGVEGAEDLSGLRQQPRQPAWIGRSTGGGDAMSCGMKREEAQRVDGGFAVSIR